MNPFALLANHSALSSIVAFFLLSNAVDALKLCPPKPTDGRLYVFFYAFFMASAGNAITLIRNISQLNKDKLLP